MNPTLNAQELHNFLFESDTLKIENNHKTEEFNFMEVWNGLNVNIPSTIEHNDESTSLSNLIGDITPAAMAVVAGVNNGIQESPMMDTPFLDSSMSTPFTPNNMLFTPQQIDHSSFYSPYINTSQQLDGLSSNIDSDIQVASYLKNDSSWQESITPSVPETPTITASYMFGSLDTNALNGDPNQLLLQNDESSKDDSLFPPMNNQHDITFDNSNPTDLLNTQDFNIDDCFEDIFFGLNEDNNINVTPEVIPTNKRKIQDDTKEPNKRVKIVSKKKSVVNEEKRFECDICHTKFSRRYNLGTHIKTHDKTRSKDFSCTICSKPFDRKHDLSRHIATVHNGERAFGCTECVSFFSRKDALVRHRVQKHNHQP